ncbi:BrnA antitoxin family protein [Terrihabitans sp. B22-R8]|uniref:BrnA antitoxin family protein n=1 Tax=Terrihabitans sp. B22-R8 TaxID=3425128 RepID=UPI00403D1A76
MTKHKGFTQADMDAVSDNPEITPEEFAQAKPARDVLPAAFLDAVAKRRRGPQKVRPTKQLLSLRLDPDVIERWKASGPGWQSRINEALRQAAPK